MKVRHSQGEYEVRFTTLEAAAAELPSDSLVVTDSNVARHWGAPFERHPTLAMAAGEASKSVAALETVLRWLAERGASRSATLVALGGGVVGDLAGLAAAIYMRGVRLIQAPTSLLAQVDSSVGGKVAVNLPEGKNLVGAFYPPAIVCISVEVLDTLPEREFLNGTAEVWKYGAIMDAALFDDLERRPLAPKDPRTRRIVRRCVELKAKVVQEDEFDRSGLRSELNFGHTVGHAIERLSGYGPILHGEAVAIGMVVESMLGERLGFTEKGTAERISKAVGAQGLPTAMPKLDAGGLVEAMKLDKKAQKGNLAFALLRKVGECKLVGDVHEADVLATLREI